MRRTIKKIAKALAWIGAIGFVLSVTALITKGPSNSLVWITVGSIMTTFLSTFVYGTIKGDYYDTF